MKAFIFGIFAFLCIERCNGQVMQYTVTSLNEENVEITLNFNPSEDLIIKFYGIKSFIPVKVLKGSRYYTIIGKVYKGNIINIMDSVANELDFEIERSNTY
jgi:hypothetical protein